jgi:hypothetical protein
MRSAGQEMLGSDVGPARFASPKPSTGHFIATFCKPQTFEGAFQNILGGFTPCFCDVVLLGAGHPHCRVAP